MSPIFFTPRQLRTAVAIAIVPTLFACAAETPEPEGPPPCPTPGDSIVGGAIETFITTRSVIPHRFLVPPTSASTSGAVPEGAQYSLYAKGRQQYIWPPDSALQEQQISNMRSMGKHVTMVLTYHGTQDMPDGKKAVELRGKYVDIANAGLPEQHTRIVFDCQATGTARWTAADAAPAAGGAAGG